MASRRCRPVLKALLVAMHPRILLILPPVKSWWNATRRLTADKFEEIKVPRGCFLQGSCLLTICISPLHSATPWWATRSTRTDEALIEIYRRLRPGDPPTLKSSLALFDNLFFNPERYDLSAVGRLKLNYKLDLKVWQDCTVLNAPCMIAPTDLLHPESVVDRLLKGKRAIETVLQGRLPADLLKALKRSIWSHRFLKISRNNCAGTQY